MILSRINIGKNRLRNSGTPVQVAERFLLEGQEYRLLCASEGLDFDLEEAGFLPAGDDAAYDALRLGFGVEQGCFLLKDMLMFKADGDYPPVGDIAPVPAENIGPNPGWAVYGLGLPLDYTGRLLLCRGLLHRYYSHAPWAYQESLELAFEQGKLTGTASVQETVRTAREMLYRPELQDDLLDLAGKVWWLRACLGLSDKLPAGHNKEE